MDSFLNDRSGRGVVACRRKPFMVRTNFGTLTVAHILSYLAIFREKYSCDSMLILFSERGLYFVRLVAWTVMGGAVFSGRVF